MDALKILGVKFFGFCDWVVDELLRVEVVEDQSVDLVSDVQLLLKKLVELVELHFA